MLLDLVDAAEAEDSGLPAVHAGVARGQALNRGGDLYGLAGEPGEPDRPVRPARQRAWPSEERRARRPRGDYDWSFAGRRRFKGVADAVTCSGCGRRRRPSRR